MANFDIEKVRSEFPALAKGQVFFDNAGGSQTLGTVIDAIRDYLLQSNVQLGATYKTGQLATESYNAGYAAGARYFNADVSEIVFGPSTTQLLRNLSSTLTFTEGDEIIVSRIDHEANIAPWVSLASRQKLILKWWTPTSSPSPSPSSNTDNNNNNIDMQLLAKDLTPLLTPRTRLVAFTHVSNIFGTIASVPNISAAVRSGPSPNALVIGDGVSYAPHRSSIDVRALDVDVYAFSWYKVFGPHIAMLYASKRAQGEMRQSLGPFFKKGDTLEEKIGLAGASYELLASIPRITTYLQRISSSSRQHEEALQKTLLSYLVSRPDIVVYGDVTGDPDIRVPTVSFRVAGWDSRVVVETIEGAESDLGFRWGSFYSVRLVRDILGLGDDGVVRVSLAHYNSLDEVKRFIEALEKYVPRKNKDSRL
ncbi:aminotransferase class-V [Poronia punctata]|nr:aminotransferase class-V [Poronia punctata]